MNCTELSLKSIKYGIEEYPIAKNIIAGYENKERKTVSQIRHLRLQVESWEKLLTQANDLGIEWSESNYDPELLFVEIQSMQEWV